MYLAADDTVNMHEYQQALHAQALAIIAARNAKDTKAEAAARQQFNALAHLNTEAAAAQQKIIEEQDKNSPWDALGKGAQAITALAVVGLAFMLFRRK